jgi:hypothetical protein
MKIIARFGITRWIFAAFFFYRFLYRHTMPKRPIPLQSPSITPLTFTRILQTFLKLPALSESKRRKIQMCSFWIAATGLIEAIWHL